MSLPQVQWAQGLNDVTVTILRPVGGCKSSDASHSKTAPSHSVSAQQAQVTVEEQRLRYSCGHEGCCRLDVQLWQAVDMNATKLSIASLAEKSTEIFLRKKTAGQWWDHLLAAEDKQRLGRKCRIDFVRFVDEEDAREAVKVHQLPPFLRFSPDTQAYAI